ARGFSSGACCCTVLGSMIATAVLPDAVEAAPRAVTTRLNSAFSPSDLCRSVPVAGPAEKLKNAAQEDCPEYRIEYAQRAQILAAEEPILAGVAGRYATALFDLAQEASAIEVVKSDLDRFDVLIAESPDLVRLVRSPGFSASEQLQALSAARARR